MRLDFDRADHQSADGPDMTTALARSRAGPFLLCRRGRRGPPSRLAASDVGHSFWLPSCSCLTRAPCAGAKRGAARGELSFDARSPMARLRVPDGHQGLEGFPYALEISRQGDNTFVANAM